MRGAMFLTAILVLSISSGSQARADGHDALLKLNQAFTPFGYTVNRAATKTCAIRTVLDRAKFLASIPSLNRDGA